MTLNLLSVGQVKSQLGISNTTYDSDIASMLPIVSADVRRILNDSLSKYQSAEYSAGSAALKAYDGSINATLAKYGHIPVDYAPLSMGDVIVGSGIPDDTYVISYDWESGNYTMSSNATGSGSYVVKTININQWPAISKMIWYRIDKKNTASVSDKNVQSESYGKISKTYSQSEINSRWNYPQQLIDDLGQPFAKVG